MRDDFRNGVATVSGDASMRSRTMRERIQYCLPGRLGLTFAPHRTMSESKPSPIEQPNTPVASVPADAPAEESPAPPVEIGGRASGLEPTRYGDWELNGRCIDF
jgi:hypothetical protein